MIDKIKEINLVCSMCGLINWRLLKQKIRDSLTLFPTQQLMLETYVIDKNGKIRSHKKGKAHSYTIAWLQHMELLMNHVFQSTGAFVYCKDTAGTLQTILANSGVNLYENTVLACAAQGSITTYGILVGTGSTAVACSDFKCKP